MREMKDSGIEWIEEIPTDWTVLKNKFLFSIQSGEAITREDLIENGTYPVYGGGEKIGYYDKYNVSENSILIGRVGARCGCVTLVNTKCWATDNALIITIVDNYQYVSYVLQSADLNRLNDSNAQPLITATKILNVSVPFPPFPEQQKIAAYLNRKCSEIDALVTDIQNEIETLGEYKRSVITEAVTKGLNPDVEMKDSGIYYMAPTNANWRITKIGYVCSKLSRLFEPEDIALICSNKGKILVRPDDVTGKMVSEDDAMQGIKKGDIAIHGMDTWHGAIAISDYDGKVTRVVHVCDSTEDKRFIVYYLQHLAFQGVYKLISNGIRGNTSDFRSWDKVSDIWIGLPETQDEQGQICDYLDRKCFEIDSIIKEKQQQLETLAEYKKSLIYEYVTGKKEVKYDD